MTKVLEDAVPYVRCPRCGLTNFTVARWSHIDHCVRCATELRCGGTSWPGPPERAAKDGRHPGLERIDARRVTRRG
jgi:hypothetical protein